ncbi:MAG: hypothetical protein VW362_02000, partial [Candidatus Nanopelagicales bacterium]
MRAHRTDSPAAKVRPTSDRPPEAAIEAVCERISALVAYPRVGEAGVRWLRESGVVREEPVGVV